MAPATPGKTAPGDVAVGDTVDVPGGMLGTVRFVGSVQGKKGVFAGVELLSDFAVRGKNNGDVDGVTYFNTTVPGAGIFLPVAKASRRDSPGSNMSSYPMTPTAAKHRSGRNHSINSTPPTPSVPKFSASVGPGARAPSPQGKRSRTSLPRPDSPVRRTQATPGPRPSIGTPAKQPSRYGSPTNRFSQSVRGTAGDPLKKTSRLDRKQSIGPRSTSALANFDDEPLPPPPTNGYGSAAYNLARARSPSRANGRPDDEVVRLRGLLEDRERQLSEQANTLADMEGSLTELQTIMESSDIPRPGPDMLGDHDSGQLRQMLRERNDKIAMLTAEFDAHRADFRSTIDTLEMASTETERVYEKRIEELITDIRELESRNLDVDTVATQLRQLEELVQELEEGLEDARRGEAEARGEVEFLRGEVERTRSELRRERDHALNNRNSAQNGASTKELAQKEDEIRGLKAIIHSLSRDPIPGSDERKPARRISSFIAPDVGAMKIARDNLERQVAELQMIIDKKNGREEELQQEVERLRAGSAGGNRSSFPAQRSSQRDSRDTVILTRSQEPRSPDLARRSTGILDTMPEADSQSTATETSTLWCEICETNGHDILSCTNMFGPADGASKPTKPELKTGKDVVHEGLKPRAPTGDARPAPLSPALSKASLNPQGGAVRIIPNPMESGPVAGKESGVMDPEKWCAVCERDGHDSVDCPFEDAF